MIWCKYTTNSPKYKYKYKYSKFQDQAVTLDVVGLQFLELDQQSDQFDSLV